MKAKVSKRYITLIAVLAAISTTIALNGCQNGGSTAETTAKTSAVETQAETTAEQETTAEAKSSSKLSEADIEVTDTLENSADGEHVLTADGESKTLSHTLVTKTGESDGDEADFYGENSALFATNGGTLNLSDMVVKTDGTHANAVFSYGEGTTVNVSNSYIETSGNCSGGLMTTGGGTMNAENLTINTSGNSSAAIRSDRGGGTVNVNGGSYTTSGKGSPVIYSTADITVSNAELTSNSAQGVVVEGKNSVTLNDVNLTASNISKNSDKSSYYQAVMIYQSMSGDAAEGLSSFTMNGGTLTNKNGDVFFVNNTATEISLDHAQITNNGGGVLLRAAAAGWGSEGSNGGQVTLKANNQKLDGDMVVDSISHLNLYLTGNSSYSGAINADGQAGEVYVEIEDGSTWTLTGDSYITSLTCGKSGINLNGHKLYVNGVEYTEGSASTGEAISVTSTSGGGSDGHGAPPDGGKPDGKPNE